VAREHVREKTDGVRRRADDEVREEFQGREKATGMAKADVTGIWAKGTMPMKLQSHTRKKNENRNGTNRSPSLPMVSRAMPSRMNR